MSFAVIQTGGKQYKVKASDILKIEKLKNSKPESKIEFNEVLAYGDDKTLEVGSPLVKGAKVEAELMENSKNRTILIFKKRRRQNSRRKNGHRQQYSLIKIKKIFAKDGAVLSEAKKVEKRETKKIKEEKK
jgi:large subunit ribosomal protein L21|tara:strand:+ start:2705 stop:3097 length:393 start_codon:yes stop_codon:yes gene_type:complete